MFGLKRDRDGELGICSGEQLAGGRLLVLSFSNLGRRRRRLQGVNTLVSCLNISPNEIDSGLDSRRGRS